MQDQQVCLGFYRFLIRRQATLGLLATWNLFLSEDNASLFFSSLFFLAQESTIYVLAVVVARCCDPLTSLRVHTCTYYPYFSFLHNFVFFFLFGDGGPSEIACKIKHSRNFEMLRVLLQILQQNSFLLLFTYTHVFWSYCFVFFAY